MSHVTEPALVRPIIVCGMFRSGTSLTANIVHEWGAFGGDDPKLGEGNDSNPRGYWQYAKMGSFVSELTRAIDHDFWDPAFAGAARALAEVPHFRETGLALIADMQSAGRPWFWKDPALSVFLPFWNELWPDPIFVITVRHPYATACSWQTYQVPAAGRGKVRMVAAVLLQWQALVLSVLEHTQTSASTIFVTYERMIAQPDYECRRLAEHLCRECHMAQPTSAQLAAMTATVDPHLMNQRPLIRFDDVEEATDAQKELYRFLQAKAADPRLPFDRRRYPLHPGAREYLDNLQVLSSLYRQLERHRPAAEIAAAMSR